jgi:hypothetical protein
VTLPILLVARSRCPDPDSNLHRATYPSPPLLRSASGCSGGPIHSAWRRSIRLQDRGKLLHNNHSRWRQQNLTWRQGARRTRRPAASSSRTCDGAACPIRCWSSPTARPACSARSRMICLSDESPPTRPRRGLLCRSWAESAVAAGIRAGLVASPPTAARPPPCGIG